MRIPTWVDSASPTVRELITLRSLGIWGLRHRAAVPRIEKATKELIGIDKKAGQAELVRLLLERLTPSLSRSDYQAAARILFGLSPDSHKLTSNERRRRAGLAVGQSFARFRDPATGHERQIITELACLVDSSLQKLRTQRSGTIKARFRTQYVERRELERNVNALLDRNSTVVLIGEAGMGKTRVAYALGTKVAEESGGSLLFIEANNERTFMAGIARCMSENIPDFPSANEWALRRRFREYIEDPAGPQCTIIDNVEDGALLDGILPSQPSGRVIITARERIGLPNEPAYFRIGPMSHREAATLASACLPSIDNRTALGFVDKLGGHPLGVEAICGLARLSGMSTISSLDALDSGSIAVLLRTRMSTAERNLYSIYEVLLDKMRRDSSYDFALQLLVAVACLSSAGVPRAVLSAYLASRIDAKVRMSPEYVDTLTEASLALLEEHCLIERSKYQVRIHQLSQSIWRHLLRGDAILSYKDLHLLIRAILRTQFGNLSMTWDEMSPEQRDWFRYFWDSQHTGLCETAASYGLSREQAELGHEGYGTRLIKRIESERKILDETIEMWAEEDYIDYWDKRGVRLFSPEEAQAVREIENRPHLKWEPDPWIIYYEGDE